MNGSKIIKSKINIIYSTKLLLNKLLLNKTTTYLLSHIEHDLEANDQQVLKQP